MTDENKRDEFVITEEELKRQIAEEEAKEIEEAMRLGQTKQTSLADLEADGEELPELDAERVHQICLTNYQSSLAFIQQNLDKLSKRGMKRVMIAILQLPQGGLVNRLKGQEELALFNAGQKLMAARFTLTYEHIVDKAREEEEIERIKAAKAEETTTNDEEKNDESE